jgi:hypothetical protein
LKLCCPVIKKLIVECPSNTVAFKIPECIVTNGNLFKVVHDTNTPNKSIVVEYTNITNGSSQITPNIVTIRNNHFISIETSNCQKENTICIKTVCIPIEPPCLKHCSIGQSVSFNDVGSFVCSGSQIRLPDIPCFSLAYQSLAYVDLITETTELIGRATVECPDEIDGIAALNAILAALGADPTLEFNTSDEFKLFIQTIPGIDLVALNSLLQCLKDAGEI